MSEQRSDRMFESALPESLRRQRGSGNGCPTPDVLAAYWDRSLTREEAVQFEAHAAVCARCQASLAVL